MTTKDYVKEIIGRWEFPIFDEGERSVVVRYQMSYVQISAGAETDSNSVMVGYHGVMSVDEEHPLSLVAKTCNYVNCQVMQTKAYVTDENDVIISEEFYYANPEDLEFQLKHALDGVINGKNRFRHQYSQYESEAALFGMIEEEEAEAGDDTED